MILTVDNKRKFLITMIVIMGCAILINYGLYNILAAYFHNSNNEQQIFDRIQINIMTVLIVLAFATIIMIVLIPKENVQEVMAMIGEQEVAKTKPKTPEQQLMDMIDDSDNIEEEYDDESLTLGKKKK